MSYCCYGNLLCQEKNDKVFTNVWAGLIKSDYNDPSKSKSSKVLDFKFGLQQCMNNI